MPYTPLKTQFLGFLTGFLLIISPCIFADIALVLPEDADLLALNGRSVEDRDDLIKNNTLTLQDGTHQIVFNYTTIIEKLSGNDEFETTDVFVIVFNGTDQKLTLSTPTFKRTGDIKRFNRNPTWTITDTAGNTIDIKISPLKKGGLQINRDYEQELNIFNSKNELAALPSLSTKPRYTVEKSVTASALPAPVTPRKISTNAVVQKNASAAPAQPQKVYGISSRTLIELYQQASPAAQQEFIDWLQQ
jgi:uncharacterized protein YccT (UPF0319 family)